MRKALLIGLKDLRLISRDRSALVFLLLAPFLLTLGLGLVTGRFSMGGAGTSGLSNIPVVVVNEDDGMLGEALVALLSDEDLEGLLTPTTLADPAAARASVDADEAAAAVLIPAGLTEGLTAPPAGDGAPGPRVTLYANPTRPTSWGVVQAVVDAFMARVEAGRVGASFTVGRLLGEGLLPPAEAGALASEIGQRLGQEGVPGRATLRTLTEGGEVASFDVLAYMAPGMALMFLMFTVSNGGRAFLAERAQGTLPRLLITPTRSWQVLGGKVLGIWLTGVAQLLILIGATTLMFGLSWGDPLGVLVLVFSAAAGAVGWGILITSLARSPAQVSSIGSALGLTFGILGGSFFDISNLPDWFVTVSRITPNSWGLAGFQTLALGGGLGDIIVPVGALLLMAALLFGVGAVVSGRRRIALP